MKICNINIIGRESAKYILIKNGKVKAISAEKPLTVDENELCLDFDDALAFPGLINSHDHLDFNLFPQTGNRIYKSYVEWGKDISSNNRGSIDTILKIPKELRAEWGIYKNLLNGVTTVVNHGEYLDTQKPVIDVFQDCYSLHSVQREKRWKFKLNRVLPGNLPYVIHIGEGTDAPSFEEINKLIKWNLFKRKLVGVHGVSMNIKQAKRFAALVWCPDSNFFLLNETAKVDELKKETIILFGTDSTLSANWNLWEQLRLAKKTDLLTDKELFASLTSLPASVWELGNKGVLTESKSADIVIAKRKGGSGLLDNFFRLNPADILLILNKGKIVLFDESVCSQLNRHINFKDFSGIVITGATKYVKGNLAGLVNKIKGFSPGMKFPFEPINEYEPAAEN